MKMCRWLMIAGLALLLTACSNRNEVDMSMNDNCVPSETKQYPNDSRYAHEYSDTQLLAISSFEGTKDELVTLYQASSIRTVRVIDKANTSLGYKDGYRVTYCGETKILMFVFDDSGNKISGNFYKMVSAKSAFDSLSIGSELADVQAIDPEANYWFLYTGVNPEMKFSTHVSTDGYLIYIMYNANNVVTQIDTEPLR